MSNPLDDMPTLASRLPTIDMQMTALRADNERLRALLKEAEFGGAYNVGRCPWCGASVDRGDKHVNASDVALMPVADWPCREGCPAFTPEGEVR